jgi:hypothetical protein
VNLTSRTLFYFLIFGSWATAFSLEIKAQNLSPKLKELKLDSLKVFTVNPLDPSQMVQRADSLPNALFHQYDPARQSAFDWFHLGFAGSAARPGLFSPKVDPAVELGFRAFDLYRFNNWSHFVSKKPFSNVQYNSRLTDQRDFQLKAEFARSFENGWSLSFAHNRIRYGGGFYSRQSINVVDLALGIAYQPGKNYQGFFTYTDGANNGNDNGGIKIDTAFGKEVTDGLNRVTVNLNNSGTRIKEQKFYLDQYYSPFAKDSLGRKGPFSISMRTGFEKTVFRSFDLRDTSSNSYQGIFKTEANGLRVFQSLNRWENHLRIHFHPKALGTRLEAGIRLLANDFRPIQTQDTSFIGVFLTGKLSQSIGRNIDIRGDGSFGLLGQVGDFKIHGEADLKVDKWINLTAGIDAIRFQPDLVFSNMSVSNISVWRNAPEKTSISSLYANLKIPRWNTQFTGKIMAIDNFTYFDENRISKQYDPAFSIAQFTLIQPLRLWKFHLDNYLTFQISETKVLPLPRFTGKHCFYFQSAFFKTNLLFNIGSDIRYVSDWQGLGYFPLTGQFHLNSGNSLNLYPGIDFFTSLKIRNWRVFFRMDQVNGFWSPTVAPHYLTAGYPLNDPAATMQLRLGLNMWLYN